MEKQKGYQLALELSIENLKKLSFSNFLDKIHLSGATIENIEDNYIKYNIELFNNIFTIDYPNFDFTKTNSTISLVSKIIILHYIEKISHDTKLTGNLISYKHVPGAFNYYPVFQKKATNPILKKYNSLDKFKEIFNKITVEKTTLGDASFKIKVLPKIDIHIIFWDGDEDFPPNLDFLFDESIKNMLSSEDIVVISQMLSKRLSFL